MAVAFMGLTGPSGVLPRHYTELLLEEERRREHGLAAILRPLQSPAGLALLPRVGEVSRPDRSRAGEPAGGGAGPVLRIAVRPHSAWGRAGCGVGSGSRIRRFVFYAGLLAQQPRSASALEGMIADYLGVPAKVGQFVGQWLPLVEENRSRVGRAGRPGEDDRGAHNVLGRSAVLGKRFWDQQARFRLRLGPWAMPSSWSSCPGRSIPGARADDPLLREPGVRLRRAARPEGRGGSRVPAGRPGAGRSPPRLVHLARGEACAREMSTTPSWATAGLVARYPIVKP